MPESTASSAQTSLLQTTLSYMTRADLIRFYSTNLAKIHVQIETSKLYRSIAPAVAALKFCSPTLRKQR